MEGCAQLRAVCCGSSHHPGWLSAGHKNPCSTLVGACGCKLVGDLGDASGLGVIERPGVSQPGRQGDLRDPCTIVILDLIREGGKETCGREV